jgi:hypothetical protein
MDTAKYLKTHRFRPHQLGKYGLFGLTLLGTNSIISVQGIGLDGHIWMFNSFPGQSDYVATYTNEEGDQHTFNFKDPYIYDNTTRLEECD